MVRTPLTTLNLCFGFGAAGLVAGLGAVCTCFFSGGGGAMTLFGGDVTVIVNSVIGSITVISAYP